MNDPTIVFVNALIHELGESLAQEQERLFYAKPTKEWYKGHGVSTTEAATKAPVPCACAWLGLARAEIEKDFKALVPFRDFLEMAALFRFGSAVHVPELKALEQTKVGGYTSLPKVHKWGTLNRVYPNKFGKPVENRAWGAPKVTTIQDLVSFAQSER